MSVVDKSTVDGIAITEDKKGIRLLIADHLDWHDEYNHLIMLQEKINAYISFCEEHQYVEVFRDIIVEYAIFEFHFMYEPTANTMNFLERVQQQITEMGIKIECHISEEA